MFKNTKSFAKSAFVMALFMASSIMAPMEAQAKKVKEPTPFPTVGKTADGKYPIYDMEGELNDDRWISHGKLYNSGDLLDRMVMVDVKDVNTGTYTCDFVCKNKQGKIVGVSGKYAFLLKKK